MNSITDVLAQAVYGLHLHDLPLDNLALGQRKRTASVGRRSTTTRQELSPPNLSNFSIITEGPPPRASGQGTESRSPSKDKVDGGTTRPVRGKFQRSSTQDEEGSPRVEIPIVKRHSTPVTTGSRPSVSSALAPISEFASPEHPQGEAVDSAAVGTPYQPLVEEDPSSGQTEDEEEEEEGGGAVIANINAQSPSPTREDARALIIRPRPHSAGSSIPSQEDLGEAHPHNLGSPIPNERPLSAGSSTSQEGVRRKGKSGGGGGGGGEGQKKLLPGSIFKHRGKGRGSDNRVAPKQYSPGSPVEERKKKRKWFHTHKRSGSDSVMTMTNPVANIGNSDRETELSVASDRSSPILGAYSEKRRTFSVRRSSSDGNLHRLLQYDHTFPDMGPEPVSLKDSETGIPFRRVTTIASPTIQESRGIGGGVVCTVPSSGSGSHRPLRRSLTMDSPEPVPTGTWKRVMVGLTC